MIFILILTITSYSTNGGTAISVVPGFKTTAECLQAGDAWIASLKDKTYGKVAALCITQSK